MALTAEQSTGEAWRAVSTVHSHSGGEEGEWHSARADVLEQSCDVTAAMIRPACDDTASMRVAGQLVLEEGRDAALSTGQQVDSEVQSSRVFERTVDDSRRAATASATVSEIAFSSADSTPPAPYRTAGQRGRASVRLQTSWGATEGSSGPHSSAWTRGAGAADADLRARPGQCVQQSARGNHRA